MGDDFETWIDEEDVQWFLAHGGYIHPDVEIASSTSSGTHLRVSKGKVLPADSLIVSCPHELTISWLNVISGSEAFLSQFDLENVSLIVNQVVIVRLFILNEYLKQSKSFWWPYIRSLPQPSEKLLLGTPPWFDNRDWAWLRGTRLELGARKIECIWREEYDAATGSLDPTSRPSTSEWSWDLYKWAATIMSSRSFPSSALANVVQAGTQEPDKRRVRDRDDAIEAGSPVLIPGVDILNHRPFTKVTWQWGSANSRLVSNQEIASGLEIYNNYGPKSNEELLMGYGFTLADNTFDHCIVAAAQPKTAEPLGSKTSAAGNHNAAAIRNLREPCETPPERVAWVRLYDGAVDKGGGCSPYVFSPHFLHETALKLGNEREKRVIDDSMLDQVDFSAPVLTHNKLKVMCAIAMLLQKQHLNIVQHNAGLPQWPENRKQFHAARYRRGQLHILRAVHSSLLDQLAGLAGMRDATVRDVRVVRLEHTLTGSPKPLLTDYRAVLNAGFGTRNPNKIRERGFAEAAFSLWVCGLWLWKTSLTERSDVESALEISRPHALLQWLNFLDDVYPIKHGKEGSAEPPQSNGKPIDNICNLHTVRLTEALMGIIQAAVKKHPASLYNSTECTQGRLSRCLHIIREESVMSPNLEGRSGESNDEQLLFLDCTISDT